MSDGPEATIEPVIRDALIVPETRPLDDLLHDLQVQRTSLSVVVDEYGRTVGIVTVEDILEEVVGEIEDETDPRAAALRRLTNGDWFVRGHVSLGDLADAGIELPVDTDAYNSVGGYVFGELGPAAETRRLDHRRTATRSGSSRSARTGSRRCGSAVPSVRSTPNFSGQPASRSSWRCPHVGCSPDRQAARGPEGAAALRGASRPGASGARSRPSTWPAGTTSRRPSCPGRRSRSIARRQSISERRDLGPVGKRRAAARPSGAPTQGRSVVLVEARRRTCGRASLRRPSRPSARAACGPAREESAKRASPIASATSRPTKSSSASGPIGWPAPSFMQVSTSPASMPVRSIIRTASKR